MKAIVAMTSLVLTLGGCAAPARFAGDATIERFGLIEPGFARGARPGAGGLAALALEGYRTVVSLRRDDDERALAAELGLDYVEIPMKAGMFGAPAPSEEQAHAFLAVIDDSARRPVFVHCRHGRDRTGVMVALWRVTRGGWESERAVSEMEDHGLSPQYRAYRRYVRGLSPARGRSAMLRREL
jgi:tyrosine-protein phosphatase SIW14